MKTEKFENLEAVWRRRFLPIRTDAQNPVVARMWDFEDGFRDAWHAHEEAQLIYVTRGVARAVTPNGIWTLAPFQAIWMPPGMLHELHAIGEVTARTAYVDADAAPQFKAWTQCRVVQVGQLLDALLVTLAVGTGSGETQRTELALPLFMHELARALPALSGRLPLPDDRRLRAVCEQLLLCPENNDTIDVWGARVGASTRTLARLFRDETGLSFGQWRQHLRLVEAVARLAQGAPVATVAAELGYQSPSAFTSMFRKTLGASPQRYLRQRDSL
ncbi:AraC family transcriptional regulator [Paraburkholderia oxyphila]|uniref:AraC family transcriptional regulator n=1 Tax=Paraburkholderia oxyphila TaxID=614212 RepID=UPI000A01844F|nr:helix-turn-helix transcriptional regulator [Paraburkholderia oxyphila]